MPKVKPCLERLPVLVEAQGEMRVDRQDPHQKRKCELENGDHDRGGPDASQQCPRPLQCAGQRQSFHHGHRCIKDVPESKRKARNDEQQRSSKRHRQENQRGGRKQVTATLQGLQGCTNLDLLQWRGGQLDDDRRRPSGHHRIREEVRPDHAEEDQNRCQIGRSAGITVDCHQDRREDDERHGCEQATA